MMSRSAIPASRVSMVKEVGKLAGTLLVWMSSTRTLLASKTGRIWVWKGLKERAKGRVKTEPKTCWRWTNFMTWVGISDWLMIDTNNLDKFCTQEKRLVENEKHVQKSEKYTHYRAHNFHKQPPSKHWEGVDGTKQVMENKMNSLNGIHIIWTGISLMYVLFCFPSGWA